eukprot:5814545-Pleurochrysis_carterae.AAC.2
MHARMNSCLHVGVLARVSASACSASRVSARVLDARAKARATECSTERARACVRVQALRASPRLRVPREEGEQPRCAFLSPPSQRRAGKAAPGELSLKAPERRGSKHRLHLADRPHAHLCTRACQSEWGIEVKGGE